MYLRQLLQHRTQSVLHREGPMFLVGNKDGHRTRTYCRAGQEVKRGQFWPETRSSLPPQWGDELLGTFAHFHIASACSWPPSSLPASLLSVTLNCSLEHRGQVLEKVVRCWPRKLQKRVFRRFWQNLLSKGNKGEAVIVPLLLEGPDLL